MDYPIALKFLYSLRLFGVKLGLDNAFKLAALAGRPQDRLRFIHVAGTNGKGSTCALLESIYRAAGLRVGLYTSPHLVSFGERIQVNRQPVTEAEIARLVEGVQPLLTHFPEHAHPTFFEVVTLMALQYFAAQRCGLVIWETGLGGRMDATNIVTPLASVITNIQLEHTQWLGDTLQKIAGEKAGIIKHGVPVLTATDAPDALAVIAYSAQERNAPLTRVTWADTRRPPLEGLELPLLGDHQRLNAAVALATVNALSRQLPVAEEAIRVGLQTVRWAGRLQMVPTHAGQRILLDGAHNPAGAEALRAALHKHFPGERPAFILGTLNDKDCASLCGVLAPLTRQIWLAPVDSERTASPFELAQLCQKANASARVSACASLAEALACARAAPFVVITGSLYFIGEAMQLLGVSSASASERGLNEPLRATDP